MRFGIPTSARQLTQYLGAAIGLVGVVLCLSVIIQSFGAVEPHADRAVIGMLLALIGGAASGALRNLLATSPIEHASGHKGGELTPTVMIRCSLCQTLNDENNPACLKCGRRL